MYGLRQQKYSWSIDGYGQGLLIQEFRLLKKTYNVWSINKLVSVIETSSLIIHILTYEL